MKNPDVKSILKEFGLSEPEIAVYLALLQFGSQSAGLIAKKSALKRGHTYNVLTNLIQKGLVHELIENKTKHFSGKLPKTLLGIVEHKKEELDVQKQKLLNVIPELEKLRNPLLIQPKVRFFQGVDGIKEIYEDTIRTPNQNIYAFGDFDYFFPKQKNKELNDWIWEYATRRAKKNIWYLGILNKSKYSDLAHRRRVKQKRKLKMLKGIYLPVELNIYGNKVSMMSTYRDMVGLIIEDAPIAETLRNFHQAVWKFLPDYR